MTKIEAIRGIKELADVADIKITSLCVDTPTFFAIDTEIQQSEAVKYMEKTNCHFPMSAFGIPIKCMETID